MLNQSGKVIEVTKGDGATHRKGKHSIEIDGQQLPNGTYIIRLTTAQGVQNCRVIIVK